MMKKKKNIDDELLVVAAKSCNVQQQQQTRLNLSLRAGWSLDTLFIIADRKIDPIPTTYLPVYVSISFKTHQIKVKH